jgi:hypothetical protein
MTAMNSREDMISERVALEVSGSGLPLMEEDEWKALKHQKEDSFNKKEHEKAEKRRMIQKRLHQRESSEILKIAKNLLSTTSLDGMTRQKAVKKVNGVLSRHTKGLFKDDAWVPVNAIWKALDDEGIDSTLENTKYDTNRDGVPTSKTWKFRVDFLNDKGKPTVLFGVVVAAGCGQTSDILGKYDLVAYCS